MFPNQNQGQSQPPINLYRPGTGPQSAQGPAVQAPTGAPKLPTQFMGNKKSEGSRTIIIFVLAVLVAVFAGLFVWKYLDWSSVSSTIDYKVEQRIADEEREIGDRIEAQCNAEKNSETATFKGPDVYGAPTFEYPKNWSVYIEKNESDSNGSFIAYIHPSSIGPIKNDSVIAIRVLIQNTKLGDATKTYDTAVKSGTMTSRTISINNSTTSATVYSNNDGSAKVVVFQIPSRNQVATIRTDSAKNFGTEFQKILDSIKIES